MVNPATVSRRDALLGLSSGEAPQIDVRLQVDPLVTVLTSFAELFGPLSYRSPDYIRKVARSADRDASVTALRRLLGPGVRNPDFFIGPVATAFDEQIEAIRETPLDVVERDLTTSWDPGEAAARRWWRHPARCLAEWCQALTTYRRTVVDGLYPKLEQRLRRESARMEAGLVEYGRDAILGVLHPRLRLESGQLRLRRGLIAGATLWRPGTLVLKPMMCAADATYFTNIGMADNPQVDAAFFCAAPPLLRPGWQPGGDLRDRGLDLLIGQSKGEILRSLRRRPGTTTDLAEELGLAPSTVSFHLKVLYDAGAIGRSSRSAGIYHRLTERGRRLLQA